MADSMIERTAILLAERWRARDQERAIQGGCDINILADGYMPKARECVRAIIAAMREPTDAMVDSACSTFPDIDPGWRDAVNAYQAMIDKALKE